jgi:hypothetical protein
MLTIGPAAIQLHDIYIIDRAFSIVTVEYWECHENLVGSPSKGRRLAAYETLTPYRICCGRSIQ